MIRALVFDFDGLILETEEPVYLSWQELYQQFGCQLSFEDWGSIIGTANGEFDPRRTLERCVGQPIPEDALQKRLQRETELILDRPVLPGVEAYLKDAKNLDIKVGLASSSPCKWVTSHLERLGLIEYFQVIRASDDVKRTKPDPELYLSACQGLGVPASQAIALEDSPNGVAAAKNAGMYVVAIPNILTRRLPLEQADLRLKTLEDMKLESLLAKAEARLTLKI